MDEVRCTQCGTFGLQEGFVTDSGQGAKGYGSWISGAIALGLFGIARRGGRTSAAIVAFRCPNCAHLEIYAP